MDDPAVVAPAAPEQGNGAAQRPADDAPSGKPEGKKRKRKRKEKAKASDGDVTARHTSEPGSDPPPATEERREETTAELVLSHEKTCPPLGFTALSTIGSTKQGSQVVPTESRSGRDEDTAHVASSEATREQLPTEEQARSPDVGRSLRCPPHPLSDILTALKTSAPRQDAGNLEPVDEHRTLKYCVVVSVLALVCLYYAGFLAAYLLLSAQPEHRPSAATHDLPRNEAEFRPRTASRQETSTAALVPPP
ncbi:uncharacterized protein LOC144122900 isoform X2 [Amblyomma americanum]